MVRPYRLQAEGCFYHITGRDRKKIFLNETGYKKFLAAVSKVALSFDLQLAEDKSLKKYFIR